MIHEYKKRDKYGRSNTTFEVAEGVGRACVIVTTLPKVAQTPERKYMVTDQSVRVENGPDYARRLTEAAVRDYPSRATAMAAGRAAAEALQARFAAEAARLPEAASIGDGLNGCRMYHGQEVYARTDRGEKVLLGTLLITDGVPALVKAAR